MATIRVLGCSGGVGGALRTTSLLVGANTLIDAGSGSLDLSLAELAAIDRIVLTHSHLDHVLGVALIADAVGGMREEPLEVFGIAPTIAALRDHVFNWKLWPDFSVLPTVEKPYLRFHEISLGSVLEIEPGLSLQALPAKHAVPAVGYAVRSASGCVAFTGDTADCPEFWNALNEMDRLDAVIVETSFTSEEGELARDSGHFTPAELVAALARLEHSARIYITHLKPGDEEKIMAQFQATGTRVERLAKGQLIQV
jgi:ribonuclease BN (tRNA processing enzyme)